MTLAPVVRAVTVDVPPERAFAVFTERIGDWWPLATHSPADALSAGLAFVDGRLVETSDTGEPEVWGAVTEWDPPRRLAFTWSPGGGPETSVAVDFEGSAGQTRVVLTHEGWEAYGEAATERRTSYDDPSAWPWILGLYALAMKGTEAAAGKTGRRPTTASRFGRATRRWPSLSSWISSGSRRRVSGTRARSLVM